MHNAQYLTNLLMMTSLECVLIQMATINGVKMSVPKDEDNTDYQTEIMKQVEEGTLTIADAD